MGEDGSMKLRKGRVYILDITSVGIGGSLLVKIGKYWECPYTDWSTFKKIWKEQK